MHNITYISEVDRRRLVFLNEAVRMCETVEAQQEIRTEIAELEATRKPLGECDVDECAELRTAIWEKFDRLNRTGKYSIAHQFKLMLATIERHQATLHRQRAMEEAQRTLAEREEKIKQIMLVEKAKKENAEKEKTAPKSIVSRWTTGIGNLD
jgi:hypothetical protein